MSQLMVGPKPTSGAVDLAVAASSPRLVKAAHEFEAAMMKEMLAPLIPGHGWGDDEEAGSSSALGDFAGEALGKAISESGGFGIAKSIIRQLSHPPGAAGNHFGNSPVPAISNGNTVAGPFK